jgi:sialidase-1
VLATGSGHGIQMANGRLVVAVWLSTGIGGHAHCPSVTSVLFSDDQGKTWQRGAIAVPNTEKSVNQSETALVQLSDGRVMQRLAPYSGYRLTRAATGGILVR